MPQPSTALRGVFVLLFGICLSLFMRDEGFAQRIININPGFGTLDNTIRGDTTAAGARVDSTTVYRLQRGGLYILNGTFQHRYQVIVEAAPGAGAKPRIIQGVGSGGTAGTEAWSARGTLRMKNLYISALDELGGGHERVIRIQENNTRVVLDSCVLDQATQAGIRFDATGAKVYFLNSVISNIGTGLEIGTFCHENGHLLCGYPDIYDYDYDSEGGAGQFCLMNSGPSLNNGHNPSQICAYLKRASGWATTIELAAAMADYIDNFYNIERRHSYLGNISPTEYETLWTSTYSIPQLA